VTSGFSGSGTARCNNGAVTLDVGATCGRTAPSSAWVTSSSSVQSTQNISLSWGASGTVTSYLLRMLGPGVTGTLDMGTSTSYTGGAGASGFTNGTFNFWVTACNGTACSAESAPSTTAVTCSLPAPATRQTDVCDAGYTGTRFRDRAVTCNTSDGSKDWTIGAFPSTWNTSGCAQVVSQAQCQIVSAITGNAEVTWSPGGSREGRVSFYKYLEGEEGCEGVNGGYCQDWVPDCGAGYPNQYGCNTVQYICWARPVQNCYYNWNGITIEIRDGSGMKPRPDLPDSELRYCRQGVVQSTRYLGPNSFGY
jgi:hypothetical protein